MSHGMGHGGAVEGEKANSFRDAWRGLFKYMGRHKAWFIVAIAFACVGTVFTIVGPDYIQRITDMITAGLATGVVDTAGVMSIAALLLALYSIGAVLTFLQNYIMATISQRTASSFRSDISLKINRMPLRYFDRSSSGDVLSRVTNDVDTLGQSMNQSVGMLVTSVTMLVGSLIMMAVTNLAMMATAVLSSLVGFVLLALIMKRSQKYFNLQQADLGSMNGHVAEIYGAHDIVRTYNGGDAARERFAEINKGLMDSGFRSQFLGGLMMPLMNFVGNFGYVMVCVVGAVLTIDGQITIGTIVAFMLYVRLFTQPLSQLGQAFVSMQSVAAAAERVFAFLGEEDMPDESGKDAAVAAVEGHVEFRDVRFGYTEDREVIHGFSAEVLPGQKVAIVGPTGAGKTTIVNLLMKFYDVGSGDILVDGVSTREMTRERVHDLFCMVLQDTWIFEGTIRENIVYSKEGVSDEAVLEACEAVGLRRFVDTLPDGLDTVLSERTALSVGQRQQVTIARAIVEGAPLLILDEATSSVDTRTERTIQDAMDRLTEGRTSFVIAHRLSTIRDSDLILVMRQGEIVEQGTHESLLAAGGFYSELYNSQFYEGEEI